MEPRTRGQTYLEHLTRSDRDLLLRVAGDAAGVDTEELRRRPERVEDLLAQPAAYEAVFPHQEASDPLVGVSPFLSFAVAVHRSRDELAELPYLQEWTGPRQRVPVFVTQQLRSFLDDADHRLFLAELLASYSQVASGTVTRRKHGVVQKRRFNELDLGSLAGLLELVAEEARPGLYRRLGDLALLLTGVFPDHTARHGLSPIEVDRLSRAVRESGGMRTEDLLEAMAARGPVGLLEELGQQWYRLALDTAPLRTRALAVVASVGERYVDARRILNHLTDRHLFPYRAHWFPSSN